MAAGLLLFVGSRRPADTAGIRTKGGARLGLVVKHGEAVRIAGPDEPASPGDRVRFRYTSPMPTNLAIIGIDGAGHASIYYPSSVETERVEAGSDVLLSTAIELDDSLGTETIYALFCEAPVRLEPIRKALEARPSSPPASASCFVDRATLRKAPP